MHFLFAQAAFLFAAENMLNCPDRAGPLALLSWAIRVTCACCRYTGTLLLACHLLLFQGASLLLCCLNGNRLACGDGYRYQAGNAVVRSNRCI